jgi:hypothetical protein
MVKWHQKDIEKVSKRYQKVSKRYQNTIKKEERDEETIFQVIFLANRRKPTFYEDSGKTENISLDFEMLEPKYNNI